ncbi:MAG: TRAP transporter small permease subunit [Gemmatimonadota bacterium]|jgi:TRAP-type mannitol/chloroaromatic compound transport system permease small subunit
MHALRTVAAGIDRLNRRLGSLLRWLALLMVFMGAYNAIARYLSRYAGMSLSSNALNEAQWYAFSLIFLLGAAYALEVDAHVRVDVLYGRLSTRAQGWIDLLGTVLFLIPFCLLMLWVSYPTVRNSWIIREVSPDPGGLPRWPIKAVILLAFFLLLLQGFSEAIKAVDKIRGEPWGEDESGSAIPPSGVRA